MIITYKLKLTRYLHRVKMFWVYPLKANHGTLIPFNQTI